jgi:hypothetical protein
MCVVLAGKVLELEGGTKTRKVGRNEKTLTAPAKRICGHAFAA